MKREKKKTDSNFVCENQEQLRNEFEQERQYKNQRQIAYY